MLTSDQSKVVHPGPMCWLEFTEESIMTSCKSGACLFPHILIPTDTDGDRPHSHLEPTDRRSCPIPERDAVDSQATYILHFFLDRHGRQSKRSRSSGASIFHKLCIYEGRDLSFDMRAWYSISEKGSAPLGLGDHVGGSSQSLFGVGDGRGRSFFSPISPDVLVVSEENTRNCSFLACASSR